MITTDRLILRRWRDEDREPYAAMMTDPEIDYWLGGMSTREQALAAPAAFDARLAKTWSGYMAIERRADGGFLGAAGLIAVEPGEPCGPGVEIGLRLARHAWGHGYASEAAAALLADGFERRDIPEIVAFTAETNLRSRAVMERIGMHRDAARDFDHPAVASGHPLRRHVVYAATSLRL